jgi:hypothetical protein
MCTLVCHDNAFLYAGAQWLCQNICSLSVHHLPPPIVSFVARMVSTQTRSNKRPASQDKRQAGKKVVLTNSNGRPVAKGKEKEKEKAPRRSRPVTAPVIDDEDEEDDEENENDLEDDQDIESGDMDTTEPAPKDPNGVYSDIYVFFHISKHRFQRHASPTKSKKNCTPNAEQQNLIPPCSSMPSGSGHRHEGRTSPPPNGASTSAP